MSEDLAQFIDDVAHELDCEPDNEVILARIAAWGLALEQVALNCDPNDPPWADAEQGRIQTGDIARAALNPSPARQGSIPDRTFERDLAELRAIDRMRAERDALREALKLLLNEAGRMANATCMIVAMDKARAALNPSLAGEKSSR